MYEVLYRRAHEAVDNSTPATPGPQQPPFATERDFVEVRLYPPPPPVSWRFSQFRV